MRLAIKPKVLLRDILPRVFADAAALCAALFLAFSTYFIGYAVYWKNFPNQSHLQSAFKVLYLQNIALLVCLGIAIFALSGFYTHTRTYENRYKLLVIANAVTWTFLLEILLYTYVLRIDVMPRGVMLLGWVFSLVIVAGSRTIKDYVTESYSISRTSVAGVRETKNVLIIGGAGYIGSSLSRQLLDAGYKVRVLDSLMFGDGVISSLIGQPNFELLRGDFRHVESLVKAMRGIDAVVHLAAIVGDPACTIKADLTTEINYAATRMVIEVCKGADVNRLLFASTCSVYGASDFLMDERSAPNPISLYAQTKLDSERAFLEAKSATLHPTCFRLATVFGLSPRPRFDLVVNLLTARAVQDGKIMIFNQEQWRPFIHVNDVARAFACALQAPISVVSGEIFNVGSYHLNYSLGQVAEKIREHVPAVEIEYKENPDKRNYRVSFDKIHSYLGFVCHTRLEEGIAEIKEAIESGLVKDYRDKVFSNYEYLLGARDELLKSEPGVRLFSVLEPADAAASGAPPKAIAAAAS
jgi:nucleoside-diphosphate-sugar epimerase